MNNHIIENEVANVFQKEDVGNCLDDFDILQTLGKGSYGFVAKVKSRKNQKIYAMKMIDFNLVNDQQEIELLMNEIKIIQKLDSPHIVKYYTSFPIDKRLYIIMEYINNGDIKGYIQANLNMKKAIPEPEIIELMYQCMSGLCYIHNNKLIHRDIKPANLFLTDDKTVKIGDFGVSAERKKDFNKYQQQNQQKLEKETIMIGTPLYMSPEIFAHQSYGHKVDVYSMGCTFFELCFFSAPRLPLPGINKNGEIVTNLQDVPKKCNNGKYSQNLVNIITRMIEKDHNKRPSSMEALAEIRILYNSMKKQNSSIFCVYRCLINYGKLTEKLTKHCPPKNQLSNFPVYYTFNLALNNLMNPMNNMNIKLILPQIRELLTYNNGEFIDPGEIDCIDLIKYIIQKLFMETNRIQNTNPFIFSLDNDPEIFNRELILKKYTLNFQNYFKSFIANYFFGTFEIIRHCENCNQQRFYFENFYYLTINITQAMKSGFNLNDQMFLPNIFQNGSFINCIKFCPRCNNMKNHKEKKNIFYLPNNLIVHIKNEDQNSTQNLNYPYNFNFMNQMSGVCQNYNLNGVIQKYNENEEKRYCCIFPFNNSWYVFDGYELTATVDTPYNCTKGNVVMLFYLIN